jgi:NADPH:quinone reductase-like Zn-dependent oxidoreductase
MAAGGVGLAVLQLCRTVPEVVTFGTASAAKHGVLREQGCTHPIDYRTEDYPARARELTAGKGVDLVLDSLGGRDCKRGLRLLCPVGQLIAYSFANLNTGERRSIRRLVGQLAGVPLLTPYGLANRNRTVSGVNLGHVWGRADLLRGELAALLDLWRAGAIRPRVDGCIRSRKLRRRTAGSANAATSAKSSSFPDRLGGTPIGHLGARSTGAPHRQGRKAFRRARQVC